MIKQTFLRQKGGCQTWVKALAAGVVSFSLVFTPLIRPPAAQAAYSSSVSGNTATLTGDPADDTITIEVAPGNLLQHNLAGLGFESQFDWDSTVGVVQTLPNASNITVRINAGDGNDTIILGTATISASLLAARFDINGQGQSFHTDTLIVNDSAVAAARNVAVGSASISGIGGQITYNNIENLQISTGAGNDTINVGGAGNTLDGFKTVTLNTGGGSDTLNFNDQGDLNSINTYELSSSNMQRTSGVVAIFNYSNMESLILNTGSSSDNITLFSSSAQAPVQINTGGGTTNSLTVGGPGNSLDNLQSLLTVSGGSGISDTLTLVDTADTDANAYIITTNSFQRGSALVNFNSAIENVKLNAGGGTADSLVVTGTLGLSANTYTLTANTIQRTGLATITYSAAVDNLTLNGSPSNDQFNLQGASITTTLKGDAGRDTFAFGNGVTLFGGTIEGGPGRDKLDYTAYTGTVSVDLSLNTATGTGGISSIIDVIGGQGNDTLTGNSSANTFGGGPGNDIYRFLGGWGNDTVNESAGGGNDSLNFSAVTAALTITISSSVNTTTDGVSNATHNANEIENVISGSGNDTFDVHVSALTSHSLSLDGGPHPSADILNFNKAGLNIISSTTTITPTGRQPLFYTRIEQINIIDTKSLYLPIIRKQS